MAMDQGLRRHSAGVKDSPVRKIEGKEIARRVV
jgi:hypothetical protein